MTPADLRAEAEKVAQELGNQMLTYPLTYERRRKLLADALVAFAQRHAAQERLEGRVEELHELGALFHPTVEVDVEFVTGQINSRLTVWCAELAALGDKGADT